MEEDKDKTEEVEEFVDIFDVTPKTEEPAKQVNSGDRDESGK